MQTILDRAPTPNSGGPDSYRFLTSEVCAQVREGTNLHHVRLPDALESLPEKLYSTQELLLGNPGFQLVRDEL